VVPYLPPADVASSVPISPAPLDLDALARLADVALDELALADIVGGYRARLEAASPVDLDEAGDFVALAARLMLLKSAHLLAQPAAGEEEEATDETPAWLEPAALAELAARVRRFEGRESLAPPAMAHGIEARIEPRPVSLLQRVWREMASRQTEEAVPVHVPAFVRLESAVSALIRRLKASARIPFRRLLHTSNRAEAVVQFLAVLELLRRRTAHVQQEELFGDMIIEYREDETERAARAG
jgi:chromatin segregation and condensation protein Rec8/ScpA/Scc1 (kleisin family)